MAAAAEARRGRMIAALHAAKNKRHLDDDTYRDLVERETGKRSAKELTVAELGRVLDAINAGVGNNAQASGGGALGGKVRALWRALWDLGVLRDNGDAALAAFLKRQTGKEAMRFLVAEDFNQVIEALKEMAARPVEQGGGGVAWPTAGGCFAANGTRWDNVPVPRRARMAVVIAQWQRLGALGETRISDLAAVPQYARRAGIVPNDRCLSQFEPEKLDELQKTLGRWLRRALAKRSQREES